MKHPSTFEGRKRHVLSLPKKLILAGILLLSSVSSYGQARPDINTFSATDRTTLCSLMMVYITPQIIQQHCDYINQSSDPTLNIHSNFDFLPFHRMYIERMEDWLFLQGYPQFVPLPSWNPAGCAPTQFRVVDPDCATFSCGVGGSTSSCAGTINWCPNNNAPNYLTLPVVAGSNNDLCDLPFSPTVPGGSNPAGLSARLEAPYHNGTHTGMGGVMGNFRSPAVPAFWLWHGYVDDIWKQWEANCPSSTTLPADLYGKDNHFTMQVVRDRGEEPDLDPGPMWVSKDIWARNTNDGFTTDVHQNPVYAPSTPVYVYVRVRNRGYQASSANEQLSLHWAKAAASIPWPGNWTGTVDLDPGVPFLPAGDLIQTQNVPSIAPGDQVIIEYTWYPPDPSDYAPFSADPWHFCLLARKLGSQADPMTFAEGSDVNVNTRNNNNIWWRNLSTDDGDGPQDPPPGDPCCHDIMNGIGTTVGFYNGEPVYETYDIVYTLPYEETPNTYNIYDEETMYGFDGEPFTYVINSDDFYDPGAPITDEGYVLVAMDEELYTKWCDGGKVGYGYTEVPADDYRNPTGRRMFEINEYTAVFENITMDPYEYRSTTMEVLYPADPYSDKEYFTYDVIQRRTYDQEYVGGVRYGLNKPDCEGRQVYASPDVYVDRGCYTTIEANPRSDCGQYYWTDEYGTVVSQEPTYNVAPLNTTTYTVNYVSPEGCYSEDNTTVYVSANICNEVREITYISPNPATTYATVEYNLGTSVNSYIEIVKVDNSYSQSYTLNATTNSYVVDVSGYSPGYYFVILYCDGQYIESEALLIGE